MDKESEQEKPTAGGVFILRGMQLRIPAGGLTITLGDDGKLDTSIKFELSLNIFPYWLQIAAGHLKESSAAHERLMAAWKSSDEKNKGQELENEFAASMQCITAAATAIDGFYAKIKEYVNVPSDTVAMWRKNRMARYKQITEVLRLGFVIGPRSALQVRKALEELFRFRGWSVHPSADSREPVWIPELNIQTEWRFAAFSFQNAKEASRIALSIIAQTLARPRAHLQGLSDFCSSVLPQVREMVEQWEASYGQLYPRSEKPAP